MPQEKDFKFDHDETVGDEKEGHYWLWNRGENGHPIVVHKASNDEFLQGFTYQRYEGKIPKFPEMKTDKEKLMDLAAMVDELVRSWNNGGWHGSTYEDNIREAANMVKELEDNEEE